MKRLQLIPFILAFTTTATAQNADVADYEEVRGQIRVTEQVSREIMGRLYQINNRMKAVSRKRSNINDRMISAESKARKLTAATHGLETTIDGQRKTLARRMRALYMLGEDKLVRAIFSSGSSEDLQKMLKFLKIFTEKDYKLIRTYESNLAILTKKQRALDKELRLLLGLRKELNLQEQNLNSDQAAKTTFLSQLSDKKGKAMQKLKTIRQSIGVEGGLLDLSFFEQKGKLRQPVSAKLVRGFGIVEDDKYGYQLSHKGMLFSALVPAAVSSVYSGKIVFSGLIDGYGRTVIIDHGDHYYSVYSGLETVSVTEGQLVKIGENLSEGAKSIYFEIRHFSDAIDPKPWLKNQRGDT